MLPRSASLACVALLLASSAPAATYHVLPDGSGDFPRIQDAIDAAASGDEVVLGNGTFTGTRNRDLNFLGKNLTLRSAGGDPALCNIDCERLSRGISMMTGETAAVVEGITIRNGFGPGRNTIPPAPGWAGGLHLVGVGASFRNCVITLCSADDAAGSSLGAGAYATSSTVSFEDCEFVGNYFALRGTGAGLFAWQFSNVTATRCRFIGNRAPGATSGGNGGGIHVQDSHLTLIDCLVLANESVTGAGIATGQLCTVDFRNCLVAGNISRESSLGISQAGGIQIGYDTDGSIRSCTIAGNRAYNRGAGMTVANDCDLVIENSILWGNCVPTGIGESVYSQADGRIDFVCSDVDPAKVSGGIVSYTSSLVVDPMFCDPVPCANAPTTDGACTLDADSPLRNVTGCGLLGYTAAPCGTVSVPAASARNGLTIRCAPNPFRGTATFHYSVAAAGDVEVGIFDAAGRFVMSFDEGEKPPGTHTLSWNGLTRDGSRVRPGAYMARISSGGRVACTSITRIE